jgi:hypothetical protein
LKVACCACVEHKSRRVLLLWSLFLEGDPTESYLSRRLLRADPQQHEGEEKMRRSSSAQTSRRPRTETSFWVTTASSAPLRAWAVFNATGVRVRDFPITLDKVLPELPRLEV